MKKSNIFIYLIAGLLTFATVSDAITFTFCVYADCGTDDSCCCFYLDGKTQCKDISVNPKIFMLSNIIRPAFQLAAAQYLTPQELIFSLYNNLSGINPCKFLTRLSDDLSSQKTIVLLI